MIHGSAYAKLFESYYSDTGVTSKIPYTARNGAVSNYSICFQTSRKANR